MYSIIFGLRESQYSYPTPVEIRSLMRKIQKGKDTEWCSFLNSDVNRCPFRKLFTHTMPQHKYCEQACDNVPQPCIY